MKRIHTHLLITLSLSTVYNTIEIRRRRRSFSLPTSSVMRERPTRCFRSRTRRAKEEGRKKNKRRWRVAQLNKGDGKIQKEKKEIAGVILFTLAGKGPCCTGRFCGRADSPGRTASPILQVRRGRLDRSLPLLARLVSGRCIKRERKKQKQKGNVTATHYWQSIHIGCVYTHTHL